MHGSGLCMYQKQYYVTEIFEREAAHHSIINTYTHDYWQWRSYCILIITKWLVFWFGGVCMYASMFILVADTCIQIEAPAYIHTTHITWCSHIALFILYLCIVCVYIYVYIYIYICVCVCIYIYIYIHVYIYICMYVCMYMYMYIYIYIYIHTYMRERQSWECSDDAHIYIWAGIWVAALARERTNTHTYTHTNTKHPGHENGRLLHRRRCLLHAFIHMLISIPMQSQHVGAWARLAGVRRRVPGKSHMERCGWRGGERTA